MEPRAFFSEARSVFHASLLKSVLLSDSANVPTNADKHSNISVRIAQGIVERIGARTKGARLAGQTSGRKFEEICGVFISDSFPKLMHLRPGSWHVEHVSGRGSLEIAKFDQYIHLVALSEAARSNRELAAALGTDYIISPDIIIYRDPEEDSVINKPQSLVDGSSARLTCLRKANSDRPILHASISCKWTIRSDRAQNSRSEALNLIRNRKGHLPHIAVVTGEPVPNRIASIALGTGDIDCVYHFALPELVKTVKGLGYEDSSEILQTMIEGKRLKDISDLPLDLAV